MARRAEDHSRDPVVAANPDEDVTAEAFQAWLDQLQAGEPVRLGVTAAANTPGLAVPVLRLGVQL